MNRQTVTIYVLTIMLSVTLSILVFPVAEAGRPPLEKTSDITSEECHYIVEFYTRCFNLIIEQNNILIDQNNQIIEKLEWSNCMMLHKESQGYIPPSGDKSLWTQDYEYLVDLCGEKP